MGVLTDYFRPPTPVPRRRCSSGERVVRPSPNPACPRSTRWRRGGSTPTSCSVGSSRPILAVPWTTDLARTRLGVAARRGRDAARRPTSCSCRSGRTASRRTYSRDEELRLVQGVRQAVLDGAIADGSTSPTRLRVLAERGIPVAARSTRPDRASWSTTGRRPRSSAGTCAGWARRCAVARRQHGRRRPGARRQRRPVLPYARLRDLGVRDGLGPDADVVTGQRGPEHGRVRPGRRRRGLACAGPPDGAGRDETCWLRRARAAERAGDHRTCP